MKHISFHSLILMLVSSLCACTQSGGGAHAGDLVVTGISNNTLYIEAAEGESCTFNVTAKYDWEVLDTKGFTCTPRSGGPGEKITVTATAQSTNTSLDIKDLGQLNFRSNGTKFVGITAKQRTLVSITDGFETVYADANQGSKTVLEFLSKRNYVDVVAKGGVECKIISHESVSGRYTVEVTTKEDNISTDERKAGSVQIKVDGVVLNGEIPVMQRPAITISREKIMVPSRKGKSMTFTFSSPFQYTISTSSSAVKATDNGDCTVELNVIEDNTTSQNRKAGTLSIALSSHPECKKTLQIEQYAYTAPQTLMIYFIGTQLLSHFQKNMRDIQEALSENIQGQSRVLVFYQTTTTNGAMYEYRYDEQKRCCVEEVKKYDIPLVFQKQTLTGHLSDMMDYAPADKFVLVVSSHGKAWIPKGMTKAPCRSVSSAADFWRKAPNALDTRHIGDTSSQQYNTDEFAQGILDTGSKLEYIIFDDCFMSNIEAMYDFRKTAKYIIASPCEIMGSGFPYKTVMKDMLRRNGTEYDLEAICKDFYDYYSTSASTKSGCIALTDCSKLEAMAQAMRAVNDAGWKEPVDRDAIQAYEGISGSYNPTHIFFDLEQYVKDWCRSHSAIDGFIKVMDETVTQRLHTPMFYSAYNGSMNNISYYSGVTTSAPSEAYQEELKQTAWYKDTH